jgi:hypothetical protein
MPDIAPDLVVAPPAINTRIFGTRAVPVRPRVDLPRSTENSITPKSQMLVPEISPQEAAAAQQQFSESMETVKKNLALAKNKRLSAQQADTVSKVNSFVAEALEASSEGDWGRARNLAKKAQILSEDLAGSF